MSLDTNTLSSKVGLRDDELAGWFNHPKGELAPGFPVNPDDVVVDVGCGDGSHATFCAHRGARLILCDIDPNQIAVARARLSTYAADRIEFHVTDGNPLPLPDNVATRIVCTEVLEHVEDPCALMAEMVRIGRPSALYLITVPGSAQEMLQKSLAHPSYFERPNHIRIFQPEELAALVRNAGLQIEHTSCYGFFRSLWMAFWWQCGVPLSAAHHPLLDSWARTWSQVLDGRDGRLIKDALDKILPRSQMIVARKPR
jgi:2-polyprenyl-3-methyl-5-hydroxy-6-metoxy-1,4-benzoquinol methylase